MNFKWMEYCDLARGMSQSPAHLADVSLEAYYRCAVSRAYYGVFCTIRDFYGMQRPQRFFVSGSGKDHILLSNWLKRQTNHTMIRMGRNLEQLRRFRNWMDYATDIPSSESGNRSVSTIHQRAMGKLNILLRDMRISRIL